MKPRLPDFPATPAGETRFSHAPTVAAGLLYWQAMRARSGPGTPAGNIAAAMVEVYAEALRALPRASA